MTKAGALLILGTLTLSAFAFSSLPTAASASTFPSQSCTDYPSNPIVNTTTSGFFNSASILKVGNGYLGWFGAVSGGGRGISEGNSSDGIHWTMTNSSVLTPGGGASWDNNSVFAPNVVWNGSMYLMYYNGLGSHGYEAVGLAFSKDGVNWTKYPFPVLVAGPGSYDSSMARFADVMVDNGTYKMWYSGWNMTGPVGAPTIFEGVDYATSVDGVHWTKSPLNPLFGFHHITNVTPPGVSYFDHPSVVKVDGGYLMLVDNYSSISYDVSPDGLNWTPGGSILVAPGGNTSWDGLGVYSSNAIFDGGRLQVWYSGYGGNASGVGLASCLLVSSYIITTTTTTATQTAIQATTETTTSTVTSTSMSVHTVTKVATTIENTTLPELQALESFFLGVVVALAVAVFLIWRRVRSKAPS